ncbi:Root phototropism protein 2 [Hibiscus syriacus]|uniref:Root phototropism protein 2 n=1 Tax=Hibiscus syriacus TaxID=106335 RepID=A0A6A2ZBX1_HIBSY|nr:Root phototropism protein 2 [Hibiscus syriacus]
MATRSSPRSFGNGIKRSEPIDYDLLIQQRELLESIGETLRSRQPPEDHIGVCGQGELEKSMPVFNGGDFREVSSSMQRVAKTVDACLAEIATVVELTISKFNAIANLVPKGARKVEDDLHRAIDVYLESHPNMDEIEREKVCSSMDPLKLSYEARVHASQNKRLPVQIVLHALYYDQLKLRSGSGAVDRNEPAAVTTRNQLQADISLVKENEALRMELLKMKMYVSDTQKNNQTRTSSKSSGNRKPTFFSSCPRLQGS